MSGYTGNTRGGLAVLCAAQFVVVLDATVVATALPAIRTDLGFGLAGLSWVVTAYTVALAGLLLIGGRAADLGGARRMFRIGLGIFSLASAACALAWSPGSLIVARIAQGCGAALLSPAALAALYELIPAAEGRRRALGWWTAAGAGGGAGGWLLGGVITELAGWRWVFAVNVPIGLVALICTGLVLPGRTTARPGDERPATRDLPGRPAGGPGENRRAALDLRGAALAAIGVALLVVGLSWISGDLGGWPGRLVTVLALAVLAGFLRYERRAAHPLLPAALLRRPGVLGGSLTAAALTASTTPAMLTAVLYVQDLLRLAPARAALLFPAFNAGVIAGSALGPRLIERLRIRRVLVGGFVAVAAGAALLTSLPGAGLPVGTLVTAFAVMGTGLGAASVASTAAGTVAVPGGERGVAAGLLTAQAQLGTAAGLAVTAPLVASAAPMTGYRLGFATAALIGAAGVAAALTVPRRFPAPAATRGTDREQPVRS
jgi:MFS family permease